MAERAPVEPPGATDPRGPDAVPLAFYAPMKSPDHPVPSGDRTIARLTMDALRSAGFGPSLVSTLRIFDRDGDLATQAALEEAAGQEIDRLIASRAGGAKLWLTYHSHYKAPDLVGPAVAAALEIPYAIVEPSLSPRRREGPWARFAAANERAIAAADRLFWTTARDRPALEAAGHAARMTHLPPFLEPGDAGQRLGTPASTPLRVLTVAMMRPGDKLESYRRLARGLRRLEQPSVLTVIGDGPLRAEVEALFAPFPRFGHQVVWLGALEPPAVRRAMAEADLLVWPGVGEGVGLVWLEAQAAGLPVVAEDGPAARDVVRAGQLAAPGDPRALAAAIALAAHDRAALSTAARAAILTDHSLEAAAATLSSTLGALLPSRVP
ncbi:MAG: glycosyltransferase [Pseudomonadota bacterium]